MCASPVRGNKPFGGNAIEPRGSSPLFGNRPEENHHRHYTVTLGRDLLDDWTVAIRFGRTGQAGRELRYAAAEPESIKAIIRDRLRRRLSAPRRIGCPYRLAAFSSAPGFDAAAWLPGDVMAPFFRAA
jgi:hypothetical protein